jgi:hypothetical protein
MKVTKVKMETPTTTKNTIITITITTCTIDKATSLKTIGQ